MKFLSDWQFSVALLAAPMTWFFLGQYTAFEKPAHFFLFVVFYPIIEELAFRGGIQSSLYSQTFGRRKVVGISLANFVTSLLFTGFHFFYHPPLWASLVLLPSLVFGYFRDKYHSTKPSIILHSFYNMAVV